MADWLDGLAERIQGAGHEPRTWSAGDGRLLITDHAARVLGCAMPGVDGNLFWHHPDLASPDTVGDVLAGGGGFGGDRLWIAPEVAFMWDDLHVARHDPQGTYKLPAQMDPAGWGAIEESPARVVLTTEMRLTDHRTDRHIAVAATREISVISRPQGVPASVRVASFAIRNDLSLIEGDTGAAAGAWDLLQLPPTGTLICPTTTPVETPRSYYDPFGERHVQCDERCVRFLIDGRHRIKMGLLAEHVTGRMGYYRALDDGGASLIVRLFAPLPGEPYVDLPLSAEPTQLLGGDTLQAYNDDGSAGGFGEMEYHDPAIVAGCGPALRTGVCVTHVLVGADDAIRDAGQRLLGVPVVPIA